MSPGGFTSGPPADPVVAGAVQETGGAVVVGAAVPAAVDGRVVASPTVEVLAAE